MTHSVERLSERTDAEVGAVAKRVETINDITRAYFRFPDEIGAFAEIVSQEIKLECDTHLSEMS